jgi:hypothetical protein
VPADPAKARNVQGFLGWSYPTSWVRCGAAVAPMAISSWLSRAGFASPAARVIVVEKWRLGVACLRAANDALPPTHAAQIVTTRLADQAEAGFAGAFFDGASSAGVGSGSLRPSMSFLSLLRRLASAR